MTGWWRTEPEHLTVGGKPVQDRSSGGLVALRMTRNVLNRPRSRGTSEVDQHPLGRSASSRVIAWEWAAFRLCAVGRGSVQRNNLAQRLPNPRVRRPAQRVVQVPHGILVGMSRMVVLVVHGGPVGLSPNALRPIRNSVVSSPVTSVSDRTLGGFGAEVVSEHCSIAWPTPWPQSPGLHRR
jgi:hypothetical protein